jgi:hypothetical protein
LPSPTERKTPVAKAAGVFHLTQNRIDGYTDGMTEYELPFRVALGHAIRDERIDQKLTLRQVSAKGNIALGYLSELERGQKDASSEVIASVAAALGLYTHQLLMRAATVMPIRIPDSAEELFWEMANY